MPVSRTSMWMPQLSGGNAPQISHLDPPIDVGEAPPPVRTLWALSRARCPVGSRETVVYIADTASDRRGLEG